MKTKKLITGVTLAVTLIVGTIGFNGSNTANAAVGDLPVRYSQNFEDNTLGGWERITATTGTMSIVAAPTGNTSQHALQLVANSSSNVFIDQNSPSIQDGEIAFKIRPTTTAIREGIVFRYASTTSWASIGYDGSAWYWVNAQDSYGLVTNSESAKLKQDVFTTVKVKFVGRDITLNVNGTDYVVPSTHSLPITAGKMGARVFGASTTIIDDIEYANNVVNVPVTSVTVDKSTISLQPGGTTELSATVLPANATNPIVSWESSNTAVATVKEVDGEAVVMAIQAGTATITATTVDGNHTASSQVTVVSATPKVLTTTLSAPNKVNFGKNFTVDFGLQTVTDAVYAQDTTFEYDASLMEFVSATSLVDGVTLLEVKESPGSVRIISASQGGEYGIEDEGAIVALTFKAKQGVSPAIGTITVVEASVGDGYGGEDKAAASSVQVSFEAAVALTPDINGDGKVSIGDLAIMAAHYGKTSADTDWEQAKRSDLNNDGVIDISDLSIVAQRILE